MRSAEEPPGLNTAGQSTKHTERECENNDDMRSSRKHGSARHEQDEEANKRRCPTSPQRAVADPRVSPHFDRVSSRQAHSGHDRGLSDNVSATCGEDRRIGRWRSSNVLIAGNGRGNGEYQGNVNKT